MDTNLIEELKTIDDEKRERNIKKAIENGAVIPCTHGVIIGDGVTVEKGALILTGTVLAGETYIGQDSVIGPGSVLYNMKVGRGTHLNAFQGEDAEVADECNIGPFTHIRPNTKIRNRVHLGNFVEVKNSVVDEKTAVSHLTYVGDSDVGKNVNFGCGCVTVNYTGKEKFRTVVEDNCFIGCNTNLIAPVKVGKYGYTAAGSTITEDVPENALAIARARQVNKINWVLKKKPYKNME